MKKILLLLSVISFALAGCSAKVKPVNDKPSLVTTTGMIADMVQKIAGDGYTVTGLMGPGIDPHLYKASQGDMGKLAGADIIFYNGLHLEGKMTSILEKMAAGKNVVAVSSGIPTGFLLAFGANGRAHDPHIWFDVELWRMTIPVIRDALSAAYPQDREVFVKNAALQESVLQDLHQWVKIQVATVPPQQRIMITAHDAFGYFGRAYGITVHGLQGVSTVAEYGINDINRMVDLILESKIRAVFVETSIPRRSIEAVVAGVRARKGTVSIGGALYSDAMGAPGSGADTYAGMVRANVNTIVSALK